MTNREVGFLVGGIAGGFAVGYALCWWNRPLPQLADSQGQSVTTGPVRLVLQTGDAINQLRPILTPLASGRIPSPADIYRIANSV
jgi:hypothetical protein